MTRLDQTRAISLISEKSGAKVEDRKYLVQAIQTMLSHKGSYLLEVMVGKENNVFPMVPQGCSVSEIRLK